MKAKRRPTYQLTTIANGKFGTAQTLSLMAQFVKTYKKAPPVRELALFLTKNIAQKDWRGEISAIHEFVKNDIRYVKDINGIETVQSPVQTLRLGAGDCDDKTVLAAALLEAIGHPTRLKAVGFIPNNFNHVFPETKIGNKWVSVETTEPVQLGWIPPGLKAVMIRHVK